MKKTSKWLLTGMIALASFASCSKDDTEPGNNNNNGNNNNGNNGVTLKEEEKFLVGDWMFEKAVDTLRPKNNPNSLDISEGPIPCKMDDVYHLRADKKYTKTFGPDSCGQNPLNREEDWGLEAGGIIFADGPNPQGFANKFIKIDNDHFAISWATDLWNGHKTNVYYFKRK